MAFPTLVSPTLSTQISTAGTPHAVDITGAAAGDMLFLIGRANVGGAPFTLPDGFQKLVDADHAATSTDREIIAWKQLRTGDAEVGATSMNVTPPASSKAAYIVQRITGAGFPQISARASGSDAAPDAPNFTPVGGAQDYLWMIAGGWEGEQTATPTTPPTNYTHLGVGSGTTGNVDTNVRAYIARRTLNAASENPPSVTISAADEWSVYTVAVPPAAPTIFRRPPWLTWAHRLRRMVADRELWTPELWLPA